LIAAAALALPEVAAGHDLAHRATGTQSSLLRRKGD
jgi:hypothetical protein